MIQEIAISDLDSRLIKQLEAADRAIGKDINYSLDIYSAVLKQAPGCLELRKRLRNQQLKIAKSSNKGLGSIIGKITNPPFSLKKRQVKIPNPQFPLPKI